MPLLKIKNKIILGVFCLGLLAPVFVGAYEIRTVPTEINNDFVLEPAKVEIFLDAGSSQTKILNILNRTDKTLEFKIEVEDFSGSQDPNQTVILMGDVKGPYSLKDYIIPEVNTFTLEPQQKILLPITINIPLDAEPGGLYGSVLVSSEAGVKSGTGTSIVSRLGALFFIGVNGDVIQSGQLTSFKKIDSEEGSRFELLFANDGNVHLNPSGSIQIYNLIGTQIDEVDIEPYFAMPNSVRFREVDWVSGKLFGRYKAVASIDRGYDNMIDELEIIFWVISYKILLTIVGIILLLILIIRWLVNNFDLNITREKPVEEIEMEEPTE